MSECGREDERVCEREREKEREREDHTRLHAICVCLCDSEWGHAILK